MAINRSFSRNLLALAALFWLAAGGRGSTYYIPPDYAVTCLDAETGAVLWQTRPPELDSPIISVGGGVVIARAEHQNRPTHEEYETWIAKGGSVDNDSELFKKEPYTVMFEAATGKLLAGGRRLSLQTLMQPFLTLTQPLEALPRNLTSADGTEFVFDKDHTRHLEIRVGRSTRVYRELEDYPYDLNIAGNLAIFSLAGYNARIRGGEVAAYDLETGVLRWQFESWRHVGPPAHQMTDVAVDGGRVLVAVDQVIFALEVKTGNLLWHTSLPRQEIRPWDNPWTRFGRIGDRLVVRCYEDLFLLDLKDGRLLWAFDAGPFGEAWPTVADGRMYVAARSAQASLTSTSAGGAPGTGRPSLVLVRQSGTDFSLELVTTDAVPDDAATRSSLSANSPSKKADEIVVELHDDVPFGQFDSRIDISGAMEAEGFAYVKFSSRIDRVVLFRNRKEVAELPVSPYARSAL